MRARRVLGLNPLDGCSVESLVALAGPDGNAIRDSWIYQPAVLFRFPSDWYGSPTPASASASSEPGDTKLRLQVPLFCRPVVSSEGNCIGIRHTPATAAAASGYFP